jgi:hypothetical protein
MLKRRFHIKIKSTNDTTHIYNEEPSNEFWERLLADPEIKGFIAKNMEESHFEEVDSVIPTLYFGEI